MIGTPPTDAAAPALWRGRRVPTADATGEVALATSSTAYLSLQTLGDGRRTLVAVHDERARLPRGPASVVAAGFPPLTPGAAVAITGGRLRVGTPTPWAVHLAGTPVWAAPGHPPIDGVRAASLVAALLGPGAPALAAAHSRLAAPIGEVLRALRRPDPAALDAAVARTIGFGPGLTPSGDDALAGLVLTLSRLERGGPPTALLADAITRHLPATTAVSAQLLALACAGEGDEAVEAVLHAGATASTAQGVGAPLARLLRLGATSGADTLYGIAAGLRLAAAAGGVRAVA